MDDVNINKLVNGDFDSIALIWSDGDSAFQAFTREEEVINLAVLVYNASVKIIAVVINEKRCLQGHNLKRLIKIKKNIFNVLNKNLITCATFGNICSNTFHAEEEGQHLPSLLSEITTVSNCSVIAFKNSGKMFRIAIAFIDFQM